MQTSPRLSVIIPTRHRPEILRLCLRRLEEQTARKELEVIVVHDGEDDDETRQVATSQWQFPLTYFAIPKSQQGVARNRGVGRATADLCLFIGDDILLDGNACERHLAAHTLLKAEGDHAAVLGFLTWDPDVGITPVMTWLEKSGWQFGYPSIANYAHSFVPVELQHSYTYSSQISLPTAIAKAQPFREDVTTYGWEDVEWGWRLKKDGVRLFYEPHAIGLHHHFMDMESSLKRMETLGASAVAMQRLAPELPIVPRGWKRWAYRIRAMLPTLAGQHAKAFLRGMDADVSRS